jgi:transposase
MSKQVFKQGVGFDVSKDNVSVCFSQRETGKSFRIVSTKTFALTASGFGKIDQWLKSHHQAGIELHLLMEASGVYYEELAYFLNEAGYRVSVILPNKAKAFFKSLDYKSKNDTIDAKSLAQMSLEREIVQWSPPGTNLLTIKRLCRERAELLSQKTIANNRLHAKNHSKSPEAKSLERAEKLRDLLSKQVTEIEKEIVDAVETDPVLKDKIDKICEIKGIRIITAATIVAETNGFELFKNKAQLVSYAGYDVVENKSGSSIDSPTRISKRGNSFIRRALYWPAITAVKHEPEFTKLFDSVFERTRIPMKAYVAVQRKLLVLIYTLFKKNEAFVQNFVNPKSAVNTML